MARLALLLALVAAAANAASLPFAARVFDMRDFRGTYSKQFRIEACPEKIFHDRLVNGNAIPHASMIVDDARCNDNGALQIFNASDSARVEAALVPYRNDTPSFNIARELITKAQGEPGSFLGSSAADRVCGPFTLKAGSIVAFVKAPGTFSLAPGVPFQSGFRVMAYLEVGEEFFCQYSAKPRMSVSPAPSASPSASATLSPGASPPPLPTRGGVVLPPGGATATDVPVPSPSVEAATAEAGDGDGSICFPESATVALADGSVKRMADVQLGDRVAVGGGRFSDVFMFTHRLAGVPQTFVRLETASGHALLLTAGHYLRVNGALRPARAVMRGDALELADGSRSAVTRVAAVPGRGLYNPQTVDGAIVVDGVVASTYTTAVEMRAAHSMLAPLRAAYGWLGLSLSALESGADGVAPLLPKGAAVY